MTKTQTFLLPLEAAPADWGFYETSRLATPAEMAETGEHCAECGVLMTSRYQHSVVAGTMVGYRGQRQAPWGWQGPWCRNCTQLHRVADGYADGM